MEVKKGYKITEIGIVPETWEISTLGKLFEFKNGLNKEKKFFGVGTPIVNYMDVYKNNGLLAEDIIGKVTVTGQEKRNYSVKKGDVFFTRTSETIEEVGIASTILEELNDTVFSGFILRARPKNSLLSHYYKKYCFATKEVRKEITSKSSYTTRALTNGRLLSQVRIPIPPLIEQQAIAEVLSDTDNLIQALEKQIAKKRLIKQGAMQHLLNLKEGWETRKLGEIGKCLRGVSYNGISDLHLHENENSVRLLRSNNVQQGIIDLNELQFVDNSKVKTTQYIHSNDIVICMANGSKQLVGKAAMFKLTDTLKYTFGAFMGAFRVIVPNVSVEFIFYNFLSNKYRSFIDVLLSGSSINNLKPCDIESIEIPYPTIEEQIRIANILSEMDAEISALDKKLMKIKQLKQALMQNLLTGKIRLINT
jgi:type I restriction enzyme S subunit